MSDLPSSSSSDPSALATAEAHIPEPEPEPEPEQKLGRWWKYIWLFVFFLFPLVFFCLELLDHYLITVGLRERPETPQLEAESLAVTILSIQYFQCVVAVSPFFRRHWFFRSWAWTLYYLPVPIAAHAVGMMLRFRPPYWLVAAFYAAGYMDAMTAYSLHDDKQGVRRFAKLTMSLAHLVWLLVALFAEETPSGRLDHYIKATSVLAGFAVFFLDLKIKSRAISPSDLSMIVSDGMRLKLVSGGDPDDFVVAVGDLASYETAVSGCTTFQEIKRLGFSSRKNDAALSCALFLQLLRRYDTPGSGSSGKNRVFMALVLAKNSKTSGRAFRVVEQQLRFMYEYFFCAHSSPSLSYHKLYLLYLLSMTYFLLTVCWVGPPFQNILVRVIHSTNQGYKPSEDVNAIFAFLWSLQTVQFVSLFWFSRWALVSRMCNLAKAPSNSNSRHRNRVLQIIRSHSPLETIHQFDVHITETLRRKLGQYSLIEDFDCNSAKQRLMDTLPKEPNFGLIQGYSKRTRACYVNQSDQVLQGIFRALPHTCRFDVGTVRPPKQNGLFGEWLRRQETHTHTILIWHIATCYCEMSPHQGQVVTSNYYETATKLSRYCAYLVAFRPELLPGHYLTTKAVLHQVLDEAEGLLGRTRTSMVEKQGRLRELVLPQEAGPQDTTFQKGVRLGRQLLGLDGPELQRWKTIAEFWTEMMLYISPSDNTDNVAAHIQHLTEGGEFITHLWALLSNVGILKREIVEENPQQTGVAPENR